MFVLGPAKMEVLNLTDVADNDSVFSQMQNPQFACAVVNQDNEGSVLTSVSGKTVTMTAGHLVEDNLVLFIFGY